MKKEHVGEGKRLPGKKKFKDLGGGKQSAQSRKGLQHLLQRGAQPQKEV